MKEHIQYNFLQDGHFIELKKPEILNDRINNLDLLNHTLEHSIIKDASQRNVLNMTDRSK